MRHKRKLENILFVHDHHPIDGGGVEVNTFSVAKELVKRGIDVTIATSISSAYQDDKNKIITGVRPLKPKEHEGVRIERIIETEQLEKLIKNHDIVHSQVTFSLHPACMYTMEYCKNHGKVHFSTIHTAPDFIRFSSMSGSSELGFDVAIKKTRDLLNNPLCNISVPSKFMINSLYKNVGVSNEIRVIHNGIPALEKPGSNKKTTDLLYLGQITEKKGVHYIIDAISMLKKKHPKIKVTMAGSGNGLTVLKGIVNKIGLKDNFIFKGYVPHTQIHDLIASTKILLLPSLTEVWPAVILEGLYLKKIIVASKVGGIPEMLANGKRGLIFRYMNAKDFAQKIDKALTDKELAKQFSKQDNHPYKIEDQVDGLLDMYCRALNLSLEPVDKILNIS
ncbi:MAG: glycosyltransferase (group 1) [Candidatus Magnetoglobus multicellularis str. Araruama]|uniref:Glycosyltransferase (Group 1) n=1 Tax=Candidatus Magnetoglobus multicellularis str. Araruama TaxID=890399 RepID=A0A1V1P8N5_9BACT|nr:MAG: glycosyltransferase (group 1) [Candidatus Magnetoglobus multicellularis str. Araruama]